MEDVNLAQCDSNNQVRNFNLMVCSFELLVAHLIVQVVFELKKIKLKCVEFASIRLFWEVWFIGCDGLERRHQQKKEEEA